MARVPSSDTGSRDQQTKLNQALRALERRLAEAERKLRLTDRFLWLGFDTGNVAVFLPLFGGTVPNASINEGWVNWLAPYNATIVEVVLFVITVSYGDTTISALVNGVVQASATRPLNSERRMAFPLGTEINAGQRLALSFLATNAGGEVTGYVRIRSRE